MSPPISKVPGFEGPCKSTWLNHSIIDNRVDGGITGFFKLTKKIWIFNIKVGAEFHGIIRGNEVYTTQIEA